MADNALLALGLGSVGLEQPEIADVPISAPWSVRRRRDANINNVDTAQSAAGPGRGTRSRATGRAGRVGTRAGRGIGRRWKPCVGRGGRVGVRHGRIRIFPLPGDVHLPVR